MGMLDDMKDKAKGAVRDHGDKIAEGVDKAKAMAKDKTGGKYDDKIDGAAEKAKQKAEEFGR